MGSVFFWRVAEEAVIRYRAVCIFVMVLSSMMVLS